MSCRDCRNLDKSRKTYDGANYCFIYNCKSNGQICGWCKTDNELKDMGCSNFVDKNKVDPKQISFFDYIN